MTSRKTFHGNLLERRESILGVFAFNKLGMNCGSGDSTAAKRHFENTPGASATHNWNTIFESEPKVVNGTCPSLICG
jgi:hypothetical protein